MTNRRRALSPFACIMLLLFLMVAAGMARSAEPSLPRAVFQSARPLAEPSANSAFAPNADALPAPEFSGTLKVSATALQTLPAFTNTPDVGHDPRIFPGFQLELFTLGDSLVPIRRGQILPGDNAGSATSYWHLIPQYGKVWRERRDDDWSRAAFPFTLVNDTGTSAHQGIATFLYRSGQITGLMVQLVQQTGSASNDPYFLAWGYVPARIITGDVSHIETRRAEANAELAHRLPAKPWRELLGDVAPGTLDGFGGPIYPKWQVAVALVRDGTVYYQESSTPYGPYPYPLEMRFAARSITKNVLAPLALLRLAQVYGPWVLALKIGDYVPDLDPKWHRVRFLDAANMATGFGDGGSIRTHPNDMLDGYHLDQVDLPDHMRSEAEKIKEVTGHLHPYPWEPGTVMRYHDQDYFILGAAIDRFLKSVRGPQSDLGEFLQQEVFTPIGIHQAPMLRTPDSAGGKGLVFCNVGYFPTLDDIAKIAMLYQDRGKFSGRPILNSELSADLMDARDAIVKNGDASLGPVLAPLQSSTEEGLYKMGFHFLRYITRNGDARLLPDMHTSGENNVILYPNRSVSIVITKTSSIDANAAEPMSSNDSLATARAVEHLGQF